MIEQTATKATDLLLGQGVLGVVCVLFLLGLIVAGLVIRGLYADNKAGAKAALEDRDRLITALHAAASAADKTSSVLESIRSTLATHKDALEDLTKQGELAAQESRHALNNVQQALLAISNRLDRPMPAARGRS